jgi:hypothetical protein
MVTVAGINGLELENEDGTIDRFDIPIRGLISTGRRSDTEHSSRTTERLSSK